MAAETENLPTTPEGEIVIRTIAMPADTNANGDIFGGWVMSQMDLGGAVLARMVARCRVVTVAVDGLRFIAPITVGDTVTCFARHLSTGKTSMKLEVQAWVHGFADDSQHRVALGTFTYVAIDAAGKPQRVERPASPAS